MKVTTKYHPLTHSRPPKSAPPSTAEATAAAAAARFLGAGLLAGINDLLSEACVDLLFENSGMMTLK